METVPQVDFWEFCLYLMNNLWATFTAKGKNAKFPVKAYQKIEMSTCHFVISAALDKEALHFILFYLFIFINHSSFIG